MELLTLGLVDPADLRIEALLRANVCPAHPGTTVEGPDRSCPMCDLEEAEMRPLLPGLTSSCRPDDFPPFDR